MLNIVTYELFQILKNSGNPKEFEQLLKSLLSSIKDNLEVFKKEPSNKNLTLIQNYIILFMILVLNLKKDPSFLTIIFNGEFKFFSQLCNIFFSLNDRIKHKIEGVLKIINNLVLAEYKGLFFRNPKIEELENIFIHQQIFFSSNWVNSVDFYSDDGYKKMFQILKNFDISYSNFFTNDTKIKDEDKPSYKLNIAQSVIRVTFSKEKKKYYDNDAFYEYDLLKTIIDKDMRETVEKFGDEYKTLFRKEDLCDDIIKYMFFIFGNSMLIDCFVKPLKDMLKKIGITDEMIEKKDEKAMKRDITKDEFNKLIGTIIDTLSVKIPEVLKILLKILYESVNNHFTIDKDNYGPLYTTLIFNFLISPRIQMLYSINPLNCIFVRSLNRLLRNTCFNFKFAEGDSLSIFNDSIETNNKKLKKFINEQIISINITDKEKMALSNLFTEKYLIYPRFLFYWDSILLVKTIQGGEDTIIQFSEMKSISKSNNINK